MRRGLLRPVPVVALVSIAREPKAAVYLYWLLQERPPGVSISHREMPGYSAHRLYVNNHPYIAWFLIKAENDYVGAIYLTKEKEIGISLFEEHQGSGYGPAAIRVLMKRYPRNRFLANINPKNKRSAKMFKHLGFKLIQHTYELR